MCKPNPPPAGPAPYSSRSEVLTLLVFSPWRRFASERDFYRYAQRELRGCFPTLPDRTQFVLQAQHCYPLLAGRLRQLAPGRSRPGRLPGGFFGFQLLLSVTPEGLITGFALAPGNAKDQPLADGRRGPSSPQGSGRGRGLRRDVRG